MNLLALVLAAATGATSPLLQEAGSARTATWRVTWTGTDARACRLGTSDCVSLYRNTDEPDDLCSYERNRIVNIVGSFVTYRHQAECMGTLPPTAEARFVTVNLEDQGRYVSLSTLFPEALPASIHPLGSWAWPPGCAGSPVSDSSSFVVAGYHQGLATILVRDPVPRVLINQCGEYRESVFAVPVPKSSQPMFEDARRRRLFLGLAWFQGN